MIKVFDNLFDQKWVTWLASQLVTSESWTTSNVANRKTWPHRETGSHRLFGTLYFERKNEDVIYYGGGQGVRNELVAAFDFLRKSLKLNLLLTEKDGILHYSTIIHFSRLIGAQYNKNNMKYVYCYSCLHGFKRKNSEKRERLACF